MPKQNDAKFGWNKCGVFTDILKINQKVLGSHSLVKYSSSDALYIPFKINMNPIPILQIN